MRPFWRFLLARLAVILINGLPASVPRGRIAAIGILYGALIVTVGLAIGFAGLFPLVRRLLPPTAVAPRVATYVSQEMPTA